MEINVDGRTFSVTQEADIEGRPKYILRGKRGAEYATIRQVKQPELMYLVNRKAGRTFLPGSIVFEHIRLTDKRGKLEVLIPLGRGGHAWAN